VKFNTGGSDHRARRALRDSGEGGVSPQGSRRHSRVFLVRQTVFIEPLEAIEQNNELQRLLDEEQREVHRILVAMTRAIGLEADAILLGTAVLAEMEAHFARARFANSLDCVQPVFSTAGPSTPPLRASAQDDRVTSGQDDSVSGGLRLTHARHPLLELRLRRSGAAAVPITLALEPDARELIISGPNTGGKTVALKTAGLLALMAQAGLPCRRRRPRCRCSRRSTRTSATRSRSSRTCPASPRTW